MTFDSQRGRTVLFGGDSGNAVLGDTWEWDGSFWTQMDDSGPGPRADHAMVYDSARQVSILFGGRDTGQTLFGDTWQWDGQDWTQLANSGPSPRGAHAPTFDSTRGAVVLFGGQDANAVLGDTWEHNT